MVCEGSDHCRINNLLTTPKKVGYKYFLNEFYVF